MSAASAMPDTGARLHAVPDLQKERFGLLVEAKRMFNDGKNFIATTSRSAWDWARRTFLDRIWNFMKSSSSWLMGKARWLGSYIGSTGGAGLGLLAATTQSGRTMVANTVGKAWGWIKNVGCWIGQGVLNVLGHLGTPGQWVADRLLDGVDLVRQGSAKAKGFWDEHLAKYFVIGSKTMTFGKITGVGLLVARVLSFVTFTPARLLIVAGAVVWAAFTVPVPQRVNTWFKETFPTVDEARAQRAKTTDAVDDAINEGHSAADIKVGNGYQDVMDDAAMAMAGAPSTEATNRASSRAAAKRAKAAENRAKEQERLRQQREGTPDASPA